jgi:hypothetical protein
MKTILSACLLFLLPLFAFCQNYSKGSKVEIKWGSGWYKGSIIDTKSDKYKVSYDGYNASWDEWVKADRLRTPGAVVHPATPVKAAKLNAPVDLPIAKYHAFQNDGVGFSFQYSLLLNNSTSYSINGHAGNYNYNRSTGVISFTNGPIKGFTGIYRLKNPNNPKDPPTIVIDFNGNVPVLGQSHKDQYIYAYLQKK